jgi:hypothetical protein
MRGGALRLMAAVLLIAAAGCGGGKVEQKAASTQSGGDSSAMASSNAGHEGGASSATGTGEKSGASEKTGGGEKHAAKAGTAQHEANHSVSGNHVRLIQARCVQFEPHWITIQLGQSLTWSSELKSAVTIDVPAGAFEKTVYVVPAGKSVSTGPARTAGSYAMSSSPAACQGAPRGVYGAGPGVTVETSAQK